MSWRPEGWKANPCDGCARRVIDEYGTFCDLTCGQETCYMNYEVGADAILEALKVNAVFRNYKGQETASYPDVLSVLVPNRKGWVVFIPEEVKEC